MRVRVRACVFICARINCAFTGAIEHTIGWMCVDVPASDHTRLCAQASEYTGLCGQRRLLHMSKRKHDGLSALAQCEWNDNYRHCTCPDERKKENIEIEEIYLCQSVR